MSHVEIAQPWLAFLVEVVHFQLALLVEVIELQLAFLDEVDDHFGLGFFGL